MEPWYRVATPRKEVREGRSFNPNEFAIALEQVVAKAAPEDYRDPKQFFDRNIFTRALREHAGMVLRRLSGRTENTAPVLTLITQFGGGKTHTLTALYHLGSNGEKAAGYAGVPDLLKEAGLSSVLKARVAVFVGNAWDPPPSALRPGVQTGENGPFVPLGGGVGRNPHRPGPALQHREWPVRIHRSGRPHHEPAASPRLFCADRGRSRVARRLGLAHRA